MRVSADILQLLYFGGRKRLPIILQSESSECGLACLAMVAGYHGYNIDLLNLRRRHRASSHGITMARLIELAAGMHLQARPLRLELDQLSHLTLPCVLHWNLNHYVVLTEVSTKWARIVDPALGERRVNRSELSESFTGVALELIPGADFSPADQRQRVSLGQLTGRIAGLRQGLTHVLILALVFNILGLLTPFYSQWVIDTVLNTNDNDLLTLLGIAFLIVTLLSALFDALRSWVMLYVSSTIGIQWATNMFSHLMRLPQDFFETRQIGDIVSRIGAIQDIRNSLTTSLISALLDGAFAILSLVIIIIYSPLLALIVTGIFLFYALLRWTAYYPLRSATERSINSAAKQQTILLESIRSTMSIKLGNLQEERTARYANAAVETTNGNVRVQQIAVIFSSLQRFLLGVGSIVVYWVATTMILDKQFTIGMLVAFASYSNQFLSRGDSLLDSWVNLKMLRLYAERLADIALTQPEDAEETQQPGTLQTGELVLEKVSFRYSEDEPWIVRKASIRIAPGETIAIVGPSGAGKTTLVKLIVGLLVPESGDITYGGVSITSLGLRTYRTYVAAVMQSDQLFSGTIADNISSFSLNASQEDIERCASTAGIHDEIKVMPMGYLTLVGNDGGLRVSEGQKQRILLARAICRNPKLLVLDEATSHLDVPREVLVAQALDELHVTRIVIAHRPETIRRCERVYYLAGGMLRQLTPHEVDVVTGTVQPTQEVMPA